MGCVCVDNGLREFPESLGCILNNNFSSTLVRQQRFLGDRGELTNNHSVTATVLFETTEDFGIFAYWYMEELDYGYLSFTIDLPIFGLTGTWEVTIREDLTEVVHSLDLREATMTFEFTQASMTALDASLSYGGSSTFPSSLGTVERKNYSGTSVQSNRFLGGKSTLNYAKVTASIYIETNADATTFMSWWMKEISYGYDIFTIELPFMGLKRYWLVKLLTDLTETHTNCRGRTINLDLELLEEVAPLLDSGIGSLICDIC